MAPYRVHLIDLKGKTGKSSQLAENIYDKMTKNGVEVLFDDRDDVRAGEKFADADLLGIPYRVIVSDKTAERDSAEIKKRDGAKSEVLPVGDIIKKYPNKNMIKFLVLIVEAIFFLTIGLLYYYAPESSYFWNDGFGGSVLFSVYDGMSIIFVLLTSVFIFLIYWYRGLV